MNKKNSNKDFNSDFIIIIIFLFLFFLFIFDLNNKLVLVLSFITVLGIILMTKNIFIGVFSFYFLTNYLPFGKTYYFKILDLNFIPHLKNEYPMGLVEEIKFSIYDVFLIIIFFHLLRLILVNKINIFKFINRTVFLYIIFLLSLVIANLIVSPNLSFSFYISKRFFEIIFVFFYLKINQKNLSLSFFLNLILIMSFFESYLALFQFFNGAPLGKEIEAIHNIEIFGKTVDEISFYYRPTGTFKHANYLGGFLSFAISLQIYQILFLSQKKISHLIVLLLSIISLFITLSRSAFYSLVIFLLFLSLKNKKLINKNLKKINQKFIFIIVLIGFLPFLLVPIFRFLNIFDPFSSSGGFYIRFNQLKEVFKLIILNPFFGTGSGFSVAEAIKVNPYGVFASFPSPIHNFYLLLAVENGIFSISFFLLFLFFMLKDFLSKKKIFSFSFILISLAFYSFFQPIFLINEIFYLYIIINITYEKNKNTS